MKQKPIIVNVEEVPGVCSEPNAIIELRNGVVMEINDDGIVAYQSRAEFGINSKIVAISEFKRV